ncbi:MAG: glutathione S-transferase family protein [Rhodospirillaceae bacterium]|nr:glutathione S-transferase family protein [Rhodospirillaceae bacterium]
MLELHHNNMSVCSAKVRLVLREKRLAPVEHHYDLRRGDQFAPAYMALNPMGVVPTLVHSGFPFFESTLICEYLDEAFPAPPLRPADPAERTAMRRWASEPDRGLHAACGAVSNALAFRYQFLALAPEELEANLAQTPDPARRERKRMGIEMGMDWPPAAAAVRVYDSALQRMELTLAAGGPWLAGDAYSLADSGLTPYVVRLDHLNLSWLWDRRPALAAWYDAVQARPNFAGLADHVEPAYLDIMDAHAAELRPKVEAALAG